MTVLMIPMGLWTKRRRIVSHFFSFDNCKTEIRLHGRCRILNIVDHRTGWFGAMHREYRRSLTAARLCYLFSVPNVAIDADFLVVD